MKISEIVPNQPNYEWWTSIPSQPTRDIHNLPLEVFSKAKSTIAPNTLYYRDCLDIMADFPNGCVDLICLDPPFNSNTETFV